MNKILISLFFSISLYGYNGFSDFSYEEPVSEQVKSYKIQQLLEKNFVSLDDDLYKDYIVKNINVNELMSSKERKLLEDSLYMQVGMISIIALLYVAPESVSKWTNEQKDLANVDRKWIDNVKAGPVVDEDEFFINYVGHPVSGAYYYTLARNNGYGWFGSFMYSFFVSTFVWEYGYESIAEIPSVQDLISTPVIGSLMGEWMYRIEKDIDKNGGLVLGSRTLGNICYALLNPLGRLKDSLDTGASATLRFQTYQGSNMYAHSNIYNSSARPSPYNTQSYGFILKVEF